MPSLKLHTNTNALRHKSTFPSEKCRRHCLPSSSQDPKPRVGRLILLGPEGAASPSLPPLKRLDLSSVQSLSRVQLFATHGLQDTKLPCPSPAPAACSNSCLSSWRGHPTLSSSVVPFSSCLQYFPASGSFPVSQLFTSGGQSIGVSASASVLPMNIQD